MRLPHRLAIVASIGLAVALAPDQAEAQVIAPSWGVPSGGFPTMAPPDAAPSFPYSYYAAFPGPARQYVPYGPLDQFPFHGSPYGQPYDRWSWATLAGSNSLQRYYYPPVR